jgi:hypothetical protein
MAFRAGNAHIENFLLQSINELAVFRVTGHDGAQFDRLGKAVNGSSMENSF